jgi:CHASE2 domain-containing sensor protein
MAKEDMQDIRVLAAAGAFLSGVIALASFLFGGMWFVLVFLLIALICVKIFFWSNKKS